MAVGDVVGRQIDGGGGYADRIAALADGHRSLAAWLQAQTGAGK